MDPLRLIEKYYPAGTEAHRILLRHSVRVAGKAREIAGRLAAEGVDIDFVHEAALLHDIGMLFTDAPEIGCHGHRPYLCHGYKGRELLEREGLPRHALVCDRHIGIGLSASEIELQKLPLPVRDMLPLSVEERIVTYADLFFSKSPRENDAERPVEKVRETLARYGAEKVAVFDLWHLQFTG
ncbi:MAG TPA: HD domain-containing protein [Desulfuromonadales bacterium]|jgi:uncharacterized protein